MSPNLKSIPLAVMMAYTKLMQSIDQGIGQEVPFVTTNDFVRDYLLDTLPSARARRDFLSRYQCHVEPVIGQRRFDQITEIELKRLTAGLRPSPNASRPIEKLSAGSINRVIAMLRVIFGRLHELGYVSPNPAASLKFLREKGQRADILRPEDEVVFFQALNDTSDKVRLLIVFLLLTGVRVGEALAARWQNVDRKHQVLLLPETKAGKPRNVPLSKQAMAVLDELETLRSNEWLFPGTGNHPMHPPAKAFRKVLARAGIVGLTLHGLRRSFGTRAAQHVPISDVSRLLGHSTVRVTERYIVTSHQNLHQAAAMVGEGYALSSKESPSACRPEEVLA